MTGKNHTNTSQTLRDTANHAIAEATWLEQITRAPYYEEETVHQVMLIKPTKLKGIYSGYRNCVRIAQSGLQHIRLSIDIRTHACVLVALRRPLIETYLRTKWLETLNEDYVAKFFAKKHDRFASQHSAPRLGRIIDGLRGTRRESEGFLDWCERDLARLNDQAHGGASVFLTGASETSARLFYNDPKLGDDIALFGNIAYKSAILLLHLFLNIEKIEEARARHKKFLKCWDEGIHQ